MPAGSPSGSEELPEPQMDLRELQLEYRAAPRTKRRPRGETCLSLDNSSAAEEEEEEEEDEEDEEEEGEEEEDEEAVASKKKRTKGGSGAGESGGVKKQPAASRSAAGSTPECKQSQRNAANARERARMRVLSKAFSRLKTSLPWVPPDTKLSKLDTLRLASSYIAHLRQLLQEDCYEKGYVHPVNLVSELGTL
ncbi:hypothetical protein E2320_011454 [Naja naja]|nr:hypothetical protein E2320_011454 [Naja naja]